jgi:eukaryotic-like serine/threonine-protein kinase
VSIGFLAQHRLAEVYIQRALTLANKAADPLAHAWALQFAALYGTGMGRWVQVTAQLEDAAEIMRQSGDRRRLGELNALRASVAYFQGDLAAAAPLFAELGRYGSQSRDTQLQTWALVAQATSAVRSGHLDQTASVLQDRRAPALEALLHLRAGEWQAARQAVQAALESVRVPPIKCYWFELYATTAEAAIALWHTSRQRGSGDRPTSRAAAEQALRCLRRYARVFPVGQPRALLCQGLLAWVDERPVRARKAWRRSLAAAERLGMRYDQMLAHHQLGGTAPRPSATSTWPAPTSSAPNSEPAARSLTRRHSPHISPDSYSRRASQARRSAMERLLWIAYQQYQRGTWHYSHQRGEMRTIDDPP